MARNLRIMVGVLAALLALAGTAAAQGHVYTNEDITVNDATGSTMAYADETTAHGDTTLAGDAGTVTSEYGLYDDGNYGDLDASAAADNAAATLDADGSMAETEEVREGGFWAWLSLHVGAIVTGVAEKLGLDVGTAADANAEAYVSHEGVDLDATVTLPCTGVHADIPCGDVHYDDTPAGEADDATWETLGSLPTVTP